MKRTSVAGLTAWLVAIVGAGAYGAVPSIIRMDPLGGTTGSIAYTVSEDGRYVGGRVTDTDGAFSAAYYDTSVGSGVAGWTVIPSGSASLPGSGVVVGIGHQPGGNVYAGLNAADTGVRPATYVVTNQFGKVSTNGAAATSFNGNSDNMVASANASTSSGYAGGGVAAFADGSDAWVAASHSQGSTSKGPESYLNKASSPTVNWATLSSGRAGTKFSTNAVSSTGRVLGWDGASATRAGAYWDGAAGGTFSSAAVVEVPHVPDFKAAAWFAYGISNNGQYAVGYQGINAVSRVQAFRADLAAGTAVVLNTVSGSPNANEQAVAFDVADDGFAVGYDYQVGRTTGGNGSAYEACAWFAQDTTINNTLFQANRAYSLVTVATIYGANLAGWSDLGVGAASVTLLGDGVYAIAGTGLYNGQPRAFLLTIPEPVTVVFLALGTLMLRRRRASN